MTARLDVTPKTTEQNRIVCTSKSEAEVTSNKKTALDVLCYWCNEANYWQTRSIAQPLCDRRASCFDTGQTSVMLCTCFGVAEYQTRWYTTYGFAHHMTGRCVMQRYGNVTLGTSEELCHKIINDSFRCYDGLSWVSNKSTLCMEVQYFVATLHFTN